MLEARLVLLFVSELFDNPFTSGLLSFINSCMSFVKCSSDVTASWWTYTNKVPSSKLRVISEDLYKVWKSGDFLLAYKSIFSPTSTFYY